MALTRTLRNTKSLYRVATRACTTAADLAKFELSDIEKACGHGKITPWHYTVPHDFKDTRTELNKAQHRGEVPDYDKAKGQARKAGRDEEKYQTMTKQKDKHEKQ